MDFKNTTAQNYMFLFKEEWSRGFLFLRALSNFGDWNTDNQSHQTVGNVHAAIDHDIAETAQGCSQSKHGNFTMLPNASN